MKISFLGAVREVGRSCFLVEVNGKNILLDCGINLGSALPEERFPVGILKKAKQIDCIIVSHAHLDHSGYIPFLVDAGFTGSIYCTKPTRDLIHLLLSDALKIAKEQKAECYSNKSIEKTLEQVKLLGYRKRVEIFSGIFAEFFNAGHIPGSCMILLEGNGKKILYTGDFNIRETHLLPGADIPSTEIDALIMESTYGGKQDNLPSLQSASKELADIIKETFARNGNVLIPAFAVGRGQEVMFAVANYVRSNYLPKLNLFVDGMITRANRICRHNVVWLKQEIPNRILVADDDPFKDPIIKKPKTLHKRDVLETENSVILATSGMLTAGPSIKYFESMAEDSRHCIVIAGYQVHGTLGRQLLDGEKDVELKNGKKIEVRCCVKQVKFSGHTDYKGLLEFVKKIKPKHVFLVHGEEQKGLEIAGEIEKKIKLKTMVPTLKETIEI